MNIKIKDFSSQIRIGDCPPGEVVLCSWNTDEEDDTRVLLVLATSAKAEGRKTQTFDLYNDCIVYIPIETGVIRCDATLEVIPQGV